MFRQLQLPEGVEGAVFLTSMPGYPNMSETYNDLKVNEVENIVCLTPMSELPSGYRQSIEDRSLPAVHENFEIKDYSTPKNKVDLKATGEYYTTFKIIPLPNGSANIISDNTIHGSDTALANERWGKVEGLNAANTLIVQRAINEVVLETLLQ